MIYALVCVEPDDSNLGCLLFVDSHRSTLIHRSPFIASSGAKAGAFRYPNGNPHGDPNDYPSGDPNRILNGNPHGNPNGDPNGDPNRILNGNPLGNLNGDPSDYLNDFQSATTIVWMLVVMAV